MRMKRFSSHVSNAHKAAGGTWSIHLVENCRPDQSLVWITWCLRFTTNPKDGPNGLRHRCSVPSKENHCGRRMPRYVRARCIDHMRQIPPWHVFLDQFPAELTLHERVGRDHPD